MFMFNKKMTMCRKFPVTLEQYKAKHKSEIETGLNDVEARYCKAKFYYSALKRPYDFEDYVTDWLFEKYGRNVKPEIAFDIWWDL